MSSLNSNYNAVKLIACYWEVAKGDVPSQDKYCSKDGTVYQQGTPINVLGAAKKGVNSLEQRIARNKRLRDTDLAELVETGEINISQVRGLKNARLDLQE
jgi:hypothetical protein